LLLFQHILQILPEYTEKEMLFMEKEMLGIYISGHPLEKIKSQIELQTTINTYQMKKINSVVRNYQMLQLLLNFLRIFYLQINLLFFHKNLQGTAYLKAYYPAEFMAATLNSFLGNLDKIPDYIEECNTKICKIFKLTIFCSFFYYFIYSCCSNIFYTA